MYYLAYTEFLELYDAACLLNHLNDYDGQINDKALECIYSLAKSDIKELRARSGLSQMKFSKLYGISYRTLQCWEAKTREPAKHITSMLKYILFLENMNKEESEEIEMNNKYKVYKIGDKYTIGIYDEGYKAIILDDIFDHFFWNTEEAAQAAADAYNNYEGIEFLGQMKKNGEKSIAADCLTEEEIKLYELFNFQIEYEDEDEDAC